MKSINCCMFTGRLVSDCTSQDYSGYRITKFSLAINESVKSKEKEGEFAERASFLDFSLFGKLGEVLAPRMKKGVSVTVIASARQARWVVNGRTASKVDFIVSEIMLHDSPTAKMDSAEEIPPTVEAILNAFPDSSALPAF